MKTLKLVFLVVLDLSLFLKSSLCFKVSDNFDFMKLINKTLRYDQVLTSHLKSEAKCVLEHCSTTLFRCMLDEKCRKAAICNTKCQSQSDVDGCNLVCELNNGYNNKAYSELLVCFVKNKCLPVSPMNGKCLAQDNQTVTTLTNMEQVSGKWWILKGLNCGQDALWRAGFDYYPCQRDEFKQQTDGSFVDFISYCGGKNNTCTTNILNTRANASMTSPGVMKHLYLDAPLLPQIEYWRVISYYKDWMLYIYCGSTPAGDYAGGSVVSRTARRIEDIPAEIEKDFIATARKFGFDYHAMCISDVSSCPN